MGPDLDTLATALYVRIDDLLVANPWWAPERPRVGFAPKLSDAELVTLAVVSALLGFDKGCLPPVIQQAVDAANGSGVRAVGSATLSR